MELVVHLFDLFFIELWRDISPMIESGDIYSATFVTSVDL